MGHPGEGREVEYRGLLEYRWTAGCSPTVGIDQVRKVMMARCGSCGSHTAEYPLYVSAGGVPARLGRDRSEEHEHDAPLGVGWVDAEVLMEWTTRHLDSTIAVMRGLF